MPYGVQVRPPKAPGKLYTGPHLCYDENVGTCRLGLVLPCAISTLFAGFDVWIGH